MTIYPQPQMAKDWKDWATKLIAQLTLDDTVPVRVQAIKLADLTMSTDDGALVLVPNATGGPALCVSWQGIFYNVRTGAAVV